MTDADLDRLQAIADEAAAFGFPENTHPHISGAMSAIIAEVRRLRGAIRKHRDQKADDRCWLDDNELYAVLSDGVPYDRRVGDKDAMLANCLRFINNRCEGGGWTSYADLEAERDSLRAENAELREKLAARAEIG